MIQHYGGQNYVEQIVTGLTPGAQYTVSYWSWQNGPSYIALRINGVRSGNAKGVSGATAWHNWGATFTAAGTSVTMRLEPSGFGTLHLDDVVLAQTPSG